MILLVVRLRVYCLETNWDLLMVKFIVLVEA